MGGGGGKSSKTKSESNPKDETQVVLNIYDLTPMNHYTYWFSFGIFHSGIEVHGMEYGFGAHDFPVSGVFEVEPKTCPGFIYRSSISLGCINIPQSEFRDFIENVASEYHGDTYHLITKNCNHFSDDIASRLTGKNIPKWVNRLARAGAACSCLLPDSLQVTTITPSNTEYHDCAEDGSVRFGEDNTLEYAENDEAGEQGKIPASPSMKEGKLVIPASPSMKDSKLVVPVSASMKDGKPILPVSSSMKEEVAYIREAEKPERGR